MRLIKIYSILTVLVALAYISLSFFKDSDYKEVGNITIEKGEVAPYEEWADILVGKWRFTGERREPTRIHLFDGEIEYFKDSTFHRFINYWLYETDIVEREVAKTNEFLAIRGGVNSTGKYTVGYRGNSKVWNDLHSKYSDHISYGYESDLEKELRQIRGLCYWSAPINKGDYFTFYYEPLLFTKEKIVLREKVLGNDDYNYYQFERIREN